MAQADLLIGSKQKRDSPHKSPWWFSLEYWEHFKCFWICR